MAEDIKKGGSTHFDKVIADIYSADFEILKGYLNPQRIGSGGYGVVHSVTEKGTQKKFAIKSSILNENEEGIPATTIREISCLMQLRHENIVSVVDVLMNNVRNKIHIVMELMDQSLKDVVLKIGKKKKRLPMDYVKSYLHQIANAIAFAHVNNIAHRDLKPENVLLSNNNTIKVTDFGMARNIPSEGSIREYTPNVSSLWYRAPEVLLGSRVYDKNVDVWGMGCIFAEMIKMKVLFMGQNDRDQIKEMFQIWGSPRSQDCPNITSLPYYKHFKNLICKRPLLSKMFPELDDTGLDLLASMLRYNPDKRIQAKDAFNHPFFEPFAFSLPPVTTLFVKE